MNSRIFQFPSIETIQPSCVRLPSPQKSSFDSRFKLGFTYHHVIKWRGYKECTDSLSREQFKMSFITQSVQSLANGVVTSLGNTTLGKQMKSWSKTTWMVVGAGATIFAIMLYLDEEPKYVHNTALSLSSPYLVWFLVGSAGYLSLFFTFMFPSLFLVPPTYSRLNLDLKWVCLEVEQFLVVINPSLCLNGQNPKMVDPSSLLLLIGRYEYTVHIYVYSICYLYTRYSLLHSFFPSLSPSWLISLFSNLLSCRMFLRVVYYHLVFI